MENSMEVSQKIKNRITIQSSISISGTLSKENKTTNSKKYIERAMSIVALFTKIWKQPMCLSLDEWIKKLWYL